jgi:preprotein translocase subunit SecF
MLVYIAFRFEWIYGVAAVIAVFHDTIITIGLFSLFNKPIDLTVIAALLTLVGYSMNDTIVTFDRIRENLKLGVRGSFTDDRKSEHQPDAEPNHSDLGPDLP